MLNLVWTWGVDLHAQGNGDKRIKMTHDYENTDLC